MPRTSSRTTRIAPSSSAGPASSSAARRGWAVVRGPPRAGPVRGPRRPRLRSSSTTPPSTTGLVVVPRESVGTAADVADRVPPGTPPMTPVRLRVDQVSSVEHAIVLGVPTLDRGRARRRSRPGSAGRSILTTLERDEAMRVLAEGESRRPIMVALASLVGGLGLVVVGARPGRSSGPSHEASRAARVARSAAVWLARPALSRRWPRRRRPSPAQVGDPRSSGQGPGLVGDPGFALLAVVAIGLGVGRR